VFIAESDEEDGAAKVGLEWLVEARPDIRTEYAINEGGGDRLTLADGRIAVLIGVGRSARCRSPSRRSGRRRTPAGRRRARTPCRAWPGSSSASPATVRKVGSCP
jgi:hypothetical protein